MKRRETTCAPVTVHKKTSINKETLPCNAGKRGRRQSYTTPVRLVPRSELGPDEVGVLPRDDGAPSKLVDKEAEVLLQQLHLDGGILFLFSFFRP